MNEAGGAPLECGVDELRTLFLFEKLTDDQLQWLCERGRVEMIEPGPVFAEGAPAYTPRCDVRPTSTSSGPTRRDITTVPSSRT